MSWTDERIEKLTKMWEGGATASQIADELGGVSRNAVIGKAHRLGLKARPSPATPMRSGGDPGNATGLFGKQPNPDLFPDGVSGILFTVSSGIGETFMGFGLGGPARIIVIFPCCIDCR